MSAAWSGYDAWLEAPYQAMCDEQERYEKIVDMEVQSIRDDLLLESLAADPKKSLTIDSLTEELAAVAKPAVMAPIIAAYLTKDDAKFTALMSALVTKAIESLAEQNADFTVRK